MRIYHISAEIAPIAKVGGLADVIYGLSRAQLEEGHDVSVILPKYDFIKDDLESVTDFNCCFNGQEFNNTMWKGTLDGIPLLLIEAHHPRMWFSRGSIYVREDDSERFLYFSRAVYDYLKQHQMPDILHMHDWQTSPLALLIQDETKKVITVHNFFHQGKCRSSLLKLINLKASKELIDEVEPSKINLLKGGILYSDRVNTVSPTYAEEVMTSKMGYGLEKVLQEHRTKFSGILNGIDYDYWNPSTDPLISHHFNFEQIEKRQLAKETVREKLSLSHEDRPLASAITRLVPQKGIDLIAHIIKEISDMGGQFALLGSSPFPQIQKQFEKLAEKYKKHPHIHIELAYNEKLSHQMYAGADILAVPSLFEPCGLTQLIALRYGCIPLVRHTGGLADTVVDGDNGLSFKNPSPKAFKSALKRAFTLWKEDPKAWLKMQHRGMDQDFSWKQSALHYLDMYQSI